MNLTSLTNKEIFRLCHSTAKKVTAKLGGHYSANFKFALIACYADIKAAKAAEAQKVAMNSLESKANFLASDMLANRKRYSQWEQEFVWNVANSSKFSAKQATIINRLYAQHA